MKSRTESKYTKFINEEIELKSKMSNLKDRMRFELYNDIHIFLKTKGYEPCETWKSNFGNTHVESYNSNKKVLINYHYMYCDHIHFMISENVEVDHNKHYNGPTKIVKWYFLRKTLEEVYMKMI